MCFISSCYSLVVVELYSLYSFSSSSMMSCCHHHDEWLKGIVLLTFLLCAICVEIRGSPASPPYDFIFGWSTGHVGTTSLTNSQLYGDPSETYFLFESHGAFESISIPSDQEMTKKKWRESSFEEEYLYVKKLYIPFILRARENKTTFLDLGHNNLYFLNALVAYLSEEATYRFIFVRIRRDRLEAALSLSFKTPDDMFKDICKDLTYRYCPWERVEDVMLHPPSRDVWGSFNTFQRALWMVIAVQFSSVSNALM